MKVAILMTSLILIHANMVFGENPYLHEGSVGKQIECKKPVQTDPTMFRPIKQLVGEKFIFLPMRKRLQHFGYQDFRGGQGPNSWPTYEECVGRIGTIVKVTDAFQEVTIQMDDNGESYTGSVSNGSVNGIAPLSDIDYARAKWCGKTLWCSKGVLLTHDETADSFGIIALKKYSPVKVINVVAGWYEFEPVRFIVQTPSGQEGFVDVNLSGTNVSGDRRDESRFEQTFLSENPKSAHKWSARAWSAIENEKVFVGMTTEQVIMSWGKPTDVNRTRVGRAVHEQWVYGNGTYLYFDNGILTGIQN
jgi:hypothetical protein